MNSQVKPKHFKQINIKYLASQPTEPSKNENAKQLNNLDSSAVLYLGFKPLKG